MSPNKFQCCIKKNGVTLRLMCLVIIDDLRETSCDTLSGWHLEIARQLVWTNDELWATLFKIDRCLAIARVSRLLGSWFTRNRKTPSSRAAKVQFRGLLLFLACSGAAKGQDSKTWGCNGKLDRSILWCCQDPKISKWKVKSNLPPELSIGWWWPPLPLKGPNFGARFVSESLPSKF